MKKQIPVNLKVNETELKNIVECGGALGLIDTSKEAPELETFIYSSVKTLYKLYTINLTPEQLNDFRFFRKLETLISNDNKAREFSRTQKVERLEKRLKNLEESYKEKIERQRQKLEEKRLELLGKVQTV